MKVYDVIVAGVGAVGAATCCELTRRGLRVLGLDRFDIPTLLGSVTSHSRAIRLAYFEHPDYVQLLLKAYKLWEALQAEAGQPLLHLTGAIYAGPPNGRVVSDSLKAAKLHNLEYELYSSTQLRERYPQFHLPEDHQAFFERRAGYVAAVDAVRAMVLSALRGGCEMRGHEPVVDWQSTAQGVEVRTARSEIYQAKKLVLCSGGWSADLLRLDVALRVTRQFSGWVWPARPELFQPGCFPVFAIELLAGQFGRNSPGLFYGFPMSPAEAGLKSAIHAPGESLEPEEAHNPRLSPLHLHQAAQEFLGPLTAYLPEAIGPLLANRTCLYTNTPEGKFIIDRHPASEHVAFACGLSGHGFKFAPVLGEALADLAETGHTDLPIDFLALQQAARR